MAQESHDFEGMFAAALAFKSDANIEAMIQAAKRLWQAGDKVSAYYILDAFWQGLHAHAVNDGYARALNEKFVPLKYALSRTLHTNS